MAAKTRIKKVSFGISAVIALLSMMIGSTTNAQTRSSRGIKKEGPSSYYRRKPQHVVAVKKRFSAPKRIKQRPPRVVAAKRRAMASKSIRIVPSPSMRRATVTSPALRRKYAMAQPQNRIARRTPIVHPAPLSRSKHGYVYIQPHYDATRPVWVNGYWLKR